MNNGRESQNYRHAGGIGEDGAPKRNVPKAYKNSSSTAPPPSNFLDARTFKLAAEWTKFASDLTALQNSHLLFGEISHIFGHTSYLLQMFYQNRNCPINIPISFVVGNWLILGKRALMENSDFAFQGEIVYIGFLRHMYLTPSLNKGDTSSLQLCSSFPLPPSARWWSSEITTSLQVTIISSPKQNGCFGWWFLLQYTLVVVLSSSNSTLPRLPLPSIHIVFNPELVTSISTWHQQ